jgi:hypothetical protein
MVNLIHKASPLQREGKVRYAEKPTLNVTSPQPEAFSTEICYLTPRPPGPFFKSVTVQ